MSTPSAPPSPPAGMKFYEGAMEALLKDSVYLDTIVNSRHGRHNVVLPLPGSSSRSDLTGVHVFGQARRLSIETTAGKDGLHSVASVGSTPSGVSLRWATSVTRFS